MRFVIQVKYLQIRNGRWEYRRVVPKRLRLAIGKTAITIPFSTADRSVAIQHYTEAHRAAEAEMSAAEASPRADTVYQRTMADLKGAGLVPHDALDVAPVPEDYSALREKYAKAAVQALVDKDPSFTPDDAPLLSDEREAMIKALEGLQRRSGKAHRPLPGAYLLGENPAYRIMVAQEFGVQRPKHRLSQALEHYLQQKTTKGNQKDLPKQCALVIKALVKIVGKDDPSLDDLTLNVAETFRKTMLEEGLAPASVRRRITTIKALLNCYIKDKKLSKELENNFNELQVADPEGLLDRDRREALTLAEIKAIAPHMQSKNAEIQDLWLLQMFTGARPSEFRDLTWADVDLDHATPHVSFRWTDERRLKTKSSKRTVPLVGKALELMIARKEANVDGDRRVFTRYAGSKGMDSVSTLQIKAMKQAGVWVKTLKVPYSLRHSVRDWVVRKAPPYWAERLQGHAGEGVGGNYGSDEMLDLLAGNLTVALKAGGVWDYPTIHLKGEVAAIPEEG